jgi:hypothetical protein
MSKQQTGVRACHMIDATDAQDERSGVVVTITSRDRLPDLQRTLDDTYADPDARYLSTGLLEWAVRDIRFLRILAKRHREMDEAS